MVRTPSSLLPNAAALFPKGGAREDGRTVGGKEGPPLNCRGSSLFGSRYMVMRHRLVKSECHSHQSRGKAKLAGIGRGFLTLVTRVALICLNSQAACC